MRQTRPSSIERNPAGWSYLPCSLPSPAPVCPLTSVRVVWQAPEERARGWSRELPGSEPLLKWGLVQSRNSEPTSRKERILLPEDPRTEKKERRKKKWGRGGERKEQKTEKSVIVKEGEGPLNVTSPALWNGFSLMLTTWYLLSI